MDSIKPCRHPDAARCFHQGLTPSLGLSPPPGRRAIAHLEATAASAADHDAAEEAFSVLLGADLGSLLSQVFGPPDAEVPGKYQPAQLFSFDANGERVAAVCEEGERGTVWLWWPRPGDWSWRGQAVSSDADSPALARFWPDFVDGLMTALGKPLSRPDLTFPPGSSPVARWQARVLHAGIPAAAPSPGSRAPRL